MVMPWPDTAYMTKDSSTSCQPSQPPQATGIAARMARNGTAMKAASATCSHVRFRSSPIVALGRWAVAASAVAGGVMRLPRSFGCRFIACATVTYGTVGGDVPFVPPNGGGKPASETVGGHRSPCFMKDGERLRE